jgi:hypothetical protein
MSFDDVLSDAFATKSWKMCLFAMLVLPHVKSRGQLNISFLLRNFTEVCQCIGYNPKKKWTIYMSRRVSACISRYLNSNHTIKRCSRQKRCRVKWSAMRNVLCRVSPQCYGLRDKCTVALELLGCALLSLHVKSEVACGDKCLLEWRI